MLGQFAPMLELKTIFNKLNEMQPTFSSLLTKLLRTMTVRTKKRLNSLKASNAGQETYLCLTDG